MFYIILETVNINLEKNIDITSNCFQQNLIWKIFHSKSYIKNIYQYDDFNLFSITNYLSENIPKYFFIFWYK